jgi:hypothetical protein
MNVRHHGRQPQRLAVGMGEPPDRCAIPLAGRYPGAGGPVIVKCPDSRPPTVQQVAIPLDPAQQRTGVLATADEFVARSGSRRTDPIGPRLHRDDCRIAR